VDRRAEEATGLPGVVQAGWAEELRIKVFPPELLAAGK
jgi:hypothetical protein